MNSIVAIVGLIKELGDAAPFHDKRVDIWTMNGGFRVYDGKRIDLLFDMHDWYKADYMPTYYQELRDLKRQKFNIMTPGPDKTLKNNRVYPLGHAIQRFGRFFKSSLSYMLAYACLRGYQDAFVYGCNLTEFLRHPEMMASFYHIEGVSRACGMKTHFVNDMMLDDWNMYGYDPLKWSNADLCADNEANYIRKKPDDWGIE